jgi:Clp amino terminal domain, pathogenicity island component
METQSHGLSLPLLDDAAATARPLGHGFIAPEHLLLAVAARPEGASGAFLERNGLTAVVHMRPPTECSGVGAMAGLGYRHA